MADIEVNEKCVLLGLHLKTLRKSKGLSLRKVEEESVGLDRKISNAYLSQLENGQVFSPSPLILKTLATIYKTSFKELMVKAGYIVSTSKSKGKTISNLTEEEEKELLKYLDFIRSKKKV